MVENLQATIFSVELVEIRVFCAKLITQQKKLPDGVMVAQLILVQFVLVQIQVGQPY